MTMPFGFYGKSSPNQGEHITKPLPISPPCAVVGAGKTSEKSTFLISISMTDLKCELLSVNDEWVRLVLSKTNTSEELPGFSSAVCFCDE